MAALVGRHTELAALDDAIARARRGGAAVVLVGGEPGIGKTRLLDELAARASASGVVAVWGRAWELGGAPAYWPWIEALRALGDPAAEILAGSRAADPGERFGVWGGVVASLRASAAQRPIALLFDDLHAADPSSLGLLELVVRSAIGGLCVAGTFRDTEARASSEIEAALGRMGRRGVVLAPARLGRDEVAALAGADRDAAAIDRLHRDSDGNPLFVLELLAAPGGARDVPRGVRAAIGDRVARLSDDARRVLEACAIVGRDVDLPVVAGVLRAPVADVVARLAEAARAGLVTAVGADRFRFTHALVAETLAGELGVAERAELHLEAARVIEAQHAGDPATPHAAIAHHLLEAGHLAAGLAVDAAVRASDAAMQQLAFEDAAALLERALAALALASPGDGARRAALLCGLGEALHRAGLHERGRAACANAGELARSLRSADLLARAAIANGIEVHLGLVDRAQVALLEEALVAQPDDALAIRAVLMARLASAKQPSAQPLPAIELARAAIAIARELGDRDLRLRVISSAMGAISDYVPPDERIACNREIVDLSTAPVDRWQALRALLRLCFDHLEKGDRSGAEAARAEYVARQAELGGASTPYGSMLDAAFALLDGRHDDDARATAEAFALAEARGDNGVMRSIAMHRAVASMLRGEHRPAEVGLEHHVPEAPPVIRRMLRAWEAGVRRDGEASRAALAMIDDGELYTLVQDVQFAVMLASGVAAAGDTARARLVYDALLPHAGTAAVAGVLGFAVLELHDRVLAMLARARGDLGDDVIARHLASALVVAERLGSAPWIARVRGEHGAPAKVPVVATAAPAGEPDVQLVCEGDVWEVRGFGESARVKDSRGMHMIAALVARPGEELHALELAGASGADGGDAGELIDEDARAAYRERIADLTATIDQAEAWGDAGRAERARREAESLREELARAIGLGGKARRAGGAGERARSNVTRRIRSAIEHVEASCPRIAAHLSRAIRTGTYCVYIPKP